MLGSPEENIAGRAHSDAQGQELLQGVRELTTAVEFLQTSAKAAADADDGYDAEEELSAAAAADDELRQLLMEVAIRLEGAVNDVSFPPFADGGSGDESTAVAAAAAHSMWRALKLLHNLCTWSDTLAVAALQAGFS